MKRFGMTVASVLLLASVTAHAQEDAGVDDAEGVATEPEPSTNNVPKLDAVEEPERGWRARVRRQREIDALYAAMAIEGHEYSRKNDAGYVFWITGGALLEVGGAAALISSFLFAGIAHSGGGGFYDGCDDSLDEECAESDEREEKSARTNAWVLLSVGLVAVAVGIPLIIKGAKGHKRQKLLKRKAEILGAVRLDGLTFAVYPSRNGPAGGLLLSGSF